MIPMHKKGNKRNINNCRVQNHINITVFVKNTGQIIHKMLYTFLKNNTIINGLQFGFRNKLNTTDAVPYFLGELLSHLENKEYNLAIFINLTGALHITDHKSYYLT